MQDSCIPGIYLIHNINLKHDMKNLKNAILILFCSVLAATTFTSCLSDDNNDNNNNVITLTGAHHQKGFCRNRLEGISIRLYIYKFFIPY